MKNKSVIYSGIIYVAAFLYVIWGILGILDLKNLVYAGYQIDSDRKIYQVDKGSPADIAGMKIGDIIIDVIRENDKITNTEKKIPSERGRSKVGEEREYVVDRNGETLTLQFTLGATTNKKKVYRVIYYIMGLVFISLGLFTHYRVKSALSLSYAAFAVFFACFFAVLFPIGPYIGNTLLSTIAAGTGISFELISLSVLVHFLLKYPPASNFIKKRSKQIWPYVPVILVLVFCWITVIFLPGKTSISDQVFYASLIIFTFVYFIWSLVILIRKFVKANSEIRRTSGLNLILWGGCLGLPSIFISVIISFITNDSTLSGGGYVLLLIIAIPLFFMLAIFKQNKNFIESLK